MNREARVKILGLVLVAAVWLRGANLALAERAGSSPAPSPTPASLVSATPAAALPEAVSRLLEDYARSFETEDPNLFRASFWDPAPYLTSFNDVCRDWFDIQVKFLQIEIRPGDNSDHLTLRVILLSRFRENRTRQLRQMKSEVQLRLERRDREWRILSIQLPSETRTSEP